MFGMGKHVVFVMELEKIPITLTVNTTVTLCRSHKVKGKTYIYEKRLGQVFHCIKLIRCRYMIKNGHISVLC
jgi:hypothetical protein